MELEVTKKVRMAIKAKLLELGVHVDEELPDYIMILIANRRTKVQMEEDLGLFLGDNTIRFSNWLHQVLKKLEEVTAAPQTKISEDVSKTTSTAASTSSTSSSSLSKKSSIEEPKVKETLSSHQSPSLEDTAAVKSSTRSTTKSLDEDQMDSGINNSSSKRKSVKDSSLSGIKSPVAKKSKNEIDASEKPTTTEKKPTRSKSPIAYSTGGGGSSSSKNTDTNLKITSKIESPSDATTKNSGSRSKNEIVSPSNPPKSVITPITFKSSSSTSSLTSKHDHRSRSPIRHSQSRKDRSVSPENDSRSNVGGNNNSGSKRRNVISLLSERSRSPISRNNESTLKSSIRYKNSGSNRRSSSTKRSRSRSPLARVRKSLKSLVAVVKRHNEINASKDEEYNPSRPSVTSSVAKVSSVVHVTERPKRATKQQERGSNNLLVRALADAQKSIIQSKTTTTTEREKEVNSSKQGDNDNDDDVSLQVDGDNNERGPSRKFSNQSESKNEKQNEPLNSDRNRKNKDGKKLSVKERLGYRIESRLNNNNTNKSSRSLERQYSDLELETGDFNEEFQTGEGDFKMIVVNVATSKTAKERNVTLEKLDKQSTVQQVEEPKRLSIQLNVDSDSDSEDELELQPNDDADFDEPTPVEPPSSNVEENDEEHQDNDDDNKNETTIQKNDKNKKAHLSKDSSSESGAETKTITKIPKKSVNNTKKEGKKPLKRKEERTIKKSSKLNVVTSDNEKNDTEQEESEEVGNQQIKQEDEENVEDQEGEVIIEEVEADEEDDDDEEIEEYEEIEEDDDEEAGNDYDVVLQENVRLPDPDEHDKKPKAIVQKKLKRVGKGNQRMEADYGGDDDQETVNAMDTASTENKEILYTIDSSSNYEMDSEGVQYTDYVNPNIYSSSARYKPINQDTKFVVTMDGNQSCDSSMIMYDEEEEEMETESYAAPESMDLRHRISRTVLQKGPSGLPQHQTSSTPLTSSQHYNASSRVNYLPITGHPPMRPPSTSAAVASTSAPACKYWPECTFKDKCVYPHPKCKYGAGCTKPNCPYKHDGGAFSAGVVDTGDLAKKTESDGKIQCKFFPKCHSMSCPFYHPTPCRFGIGCTNIKCKSFHPGGLSVGQKRSQLPFARGRHSSTVIPSANLLRWKAPTTNKTNTSTAASSDIAVSDEGNTDNSSSSVVTA